MTKRVLVAHGHHVDRMNTHTMRRLTEVFDLEPIPWTATRDALPSLAGIDAILLAFETLDHRTQDNTLAAARAAGVFCLPISIKMSHNYQRLIEAGFTPRNGAGASTEALMATPAQQVKSTVTQSVPSLPEEVQEQLLVMKDLMAKHFLSKLYLDRPVMQDEADLNVSFEILRPASGGLTL